jgi:hypothetical protein
MSNFNACVLTGKAEFVREHEANGRSTFQQVSHVLAPISVLIVQDPLALC